MNLLLKKILRYEYQEQDKLPMSNPLPFTITSNSWRANVSTRLLDLMVPHALRGGVEAKEQR